MNEIHITKSMIIPTLHYNDAPAAIEWLCRAFGFDKNLVVTGENNQITHAQLIYNNNNMIMLGSAREDEFGRLQQPPLGKTGMVTQSPYIIVSDVDNHYRRAVKEGARIVVEIRDESYGGRVYSCKDPEGHLWNFGSYNPWDSQ